MYSKRRNSVGPKRPSRLPLTEEETKTAVCEMDTHLSWNSQTGLRLRSGGTIRTNRDGCLTGSLRKNCDAPDSGLLVRIGSQTVA